MTGATSRMPPSDLGCTPGHDAGTVDGEDALPQAILTRAFSGRLVPSEAELARREGRSYEPASVLLERVRG